MLSWKFHQLLAILHEWKVKHAGTTSRGLTVQETAANSSSACRGGGEERNGPDCCRGLTAD